MLWFLSVAWSFGTLFSCVPLALFGASSKNVDGIGNWLHPILPCCVTCMAGELSSVRKCTFDSDVYAIQDLLLKWAFRMCKPHGISWKRNRRPGNLVLHLCLDIVEAVMPVHKQQTSQVLAPPLFYMSLYFAAASHFNTRCLCRPMTHWFYLCHVWANFLLVHGMHD